MRIPGYLMPRVVVAAAIVMPLLMTACSKNTTPATPAAPAVEPVAIVNGKPVDKALFDELLEGVARQSGQGVVEQHRDQLLDQLINYQLAADDAEKKGVDKDPKVQRQLALSRLEFLANAALQKYLDDHPATDEEAKKEYDKVVGLRREYRARQIVLEDQAAAEAVIKELGGGADFAALAKKKSKDAGSAKQGGDLGWVSREALENIDVAMANVVVGLTKGQTTATPLQTQYGWHVVKLEEIREPEGIPSFDDAKSQLKKMVQQSRVKEYLDAIKKDAKIEKIAAKTGDTKPAEPPKP